MLHRGFISYLSLMRLKNIWHILLILLISTLYCHAKENRTEIIVDFRVNDTRIDSLYSDNAFKVREIISFLHKLNNDSTSNIISVSFCGAASPEGSYNWNSYLAGARLASLESIVRKAVNLPDSIIFRDDSYIPWGYLRQQVEGANAEYKDTVLAIIDEEALLVQDPKSGYTIDQRIVKLKHLQQGRVWQELFHHYFSKMRNASAVIITYKEEQPDTTSILSVNILNSQCRLNCELPAPPTDIYWDYTVFTTAKNPFYMDIRSQYALRCVSYTKSRSGILPRYKLEYWRQLEARLVE